MRAFLDLVESRALIAVSSQLATRLAAEELDALRRAGILRATGQDDCEEISVADLVRALRALYGIEGRGLTTPSRLETTPALLGWRRDDGGERQVLLVSDTGYGLVSATSRSTRTLALLATSRRLTPELRARHGPDAFVALEALDESLAVADGRLVRAGVPAPDAPGLAPVAAPAALFAGVTAWSEVRIVTIDPTTVRIDAGGRTRRLSHVDLGMAHSVNRAPTRVWELLQAFCEGDGTFKSWRFGNAKATKKTVSRLRSDLRALFGLDESPFFPYRRGVGWRARFLAGDGLPEDEIDLLPGTRATLARAGKRV